MLLRVCFLMLTIIALSGGSRALAQDQNSPEELNRKYQEALAQLKSSQDRKNELATENEKLTARVAELEKKLEEARRESANIAEKTFQLRMQYASWDAFLRRHPLLFQQWKVFLTSNPLALPSSWPEMVDVTAPLGAE